MLRRKSAYFSVILAVAGIAVSATRARGQDQGEWVRIEAGTFLMGANRESDPIASYDEAPQHDVKLAAFDIGRYEVTVKEFSEFVDAGGYTNEDLRVFWDSTAEGEANRFGSWKAPDNWDQQLRHPNRPVTGVSWYEAMAYCRWRSRRDGRRITLPTEAQWERAARGLEGRRFPWGSQIPDGSLRLNYDKKVGHPTDVGSLPEGNTPGTNPISDLAGNALEWCLDRKVSYGVEPRPGDGLREGRSLYRVVRGGSLYHDGPGLRAACRGAAGPKVRDGYVGFRLVRAL